MELKSQVYTSSSWKEECGVFGIWNHEDASKLTYLGLYSLQHRGQESAGIVSLDHDEHFHYKGLGLVADVFSESSLSKLPGRAAIGHVRYSTTGQNLLTNAQPLTANIKFGPIALAHNGNIVNHQSVRKKLQDEGAIFQGTNDTEILLHLLSRHGASDLIQALKDSLISLKGAYSFLILLQNKMIGCRDPFGFRPLVLGKKVNEDSSVSWVLASETCAFDLIGAKFEREVLPGEIIWIDEEGVHSTQFHESPQKAHCIFEHVYFSRPDSLVFGKSVYETRKLFGKQLARESHVPADVIIPVPDSGVPAALGYSQESQVPFEFGIIRNHYVGRTFIQPSQNVRDFGVRIKLNPQHAVIEGKRVVIIDDSLVRGTTSRKIVNLVRQAGAREVHVRIAAPPTKGPCFYGVDTPQKSQLIASRFSQKEICDFIEADSLAYLSIEGLFKVMNSDHNTYCAACFDGKYPVGVTEN